MRRLSLSKVKPLARDQTLQWWGLDLDSVLTDIKVKALCCCLPSAFWPVAHPQGEEGECGRGPSLSVPHCKRTDAGLSPREGPFSVASVRRWQGPACLILAQPPQSDTPQSLLLFWFSKGKKSIPRQFCCL